MSEVTLFEHLLVLYKRRLSILIITLVSATTATILSYLVPSVYEARAVFFVPTTSLGLSSTRDEQTKLSPRAGSPIPPTKEELMAPYFGLLKSRTVAELVHEDFPAKRLEKLLVSDVRFELTDEFLITLYSRDRDPQLAADVANAYVRHLNRILEEPEKDAIRRDMVVLEDTIKAVSRDLRGTRERLLELESIQNASLLEDEIAYLASRRRRITQQSDANMAELEEIELTLATLEDDIKEEGYDGPLQPSGARAETLREELADVELKLREAEMSKQAARTGAADLEGLRKAILESLRGEYEALATAVAKSGSAPAARITRSWIDLSFRRAQIEASIVANARVQADLEKEQTSLVNLKVEWERLKERDQMLKTRIDELVADFQEAELANAWPVHAVVPVDAARPPVKPVFPLPTLNFFVAVIAGLLFGIVYAFSAEAATRTGRIRRRAIIKKIVDEE